MTIAIVLFTITLIWVINKYNLKMPLVPIDKENYQFNYYLKLRYKFF